ncbi:PhoU domain-containing protein [Gemmatimonadota bacterium]
MWKDILTLFKGCGLCEEAFAEALIMLETSQGMFHDAVGALHKQGALVDDIYARDRQLNKYERSVRRKILTHLTVSPKADVNMGLVITAIVIDIERIGDYAKNISELAVGLEEPFDAGELHEDVLKLEGIVKGIFSDLVPALEEGDENRARRIMKEHKKVSRTVEKHLKALREGQVLLSDSGRAVTTALYLRYLKRMSAHLKNVASSVVNPYYRIGYREKKKKGEKGKS